MKIDKYFSKQDIEEIKIAVKEAESKSKIEIVPCFLDHCDHYEEAYWRGALLLIGLSGFLILVIEYLNLWIDLRPINIIIGVFASGLIGILCVRFLPPLKRLLAGRAVLTERIKDKAYRAFVEHEVFKTKERTGVLIFLSLFERRVFIMGDSGINKVVKPKEWEDLVQIITKSMKGNFKKEGIIEAIKKCGEIVAERGLGKFEDDTDELDDNLTTLGGEK